MELRDREWRVLEMFLVWVLVKETLGWWFQWHELGMGVVRRCLEAFECDGAWLYLFDLGCR